MTLTEARALKVGQVLYSTVYVGADGRPIRWRVNGKVKTWKRDPSRVRAPLKHGLWDYDYLTEANLNYLEIDEAKALER